MKIFSLESGPVATIAYLVYDEIRNSAVVIDVPYGSTDRLLLEATQRNINIEKILLTHSHWDHIADANKLKKITNAPLYVHKSDEYRLLEPNEHSVWLLPFELDSVEPDSFVNDGDIIQVAGMKFEVIYTPGHSEGSVCYVEHNNKVVFTGDTLFYQSIGRTDLPGGSLNKIISSIKEKIFLLPDDYTVYPGHSEITTIVEEKELNPFLV